MSDSLEGKSIAIIATDYFEESELTEPLLALENAGAKVDIVAPHDGEIKGLKHIEPGESIPVDITLENMQASQYDAIVLPGGAINSDILRMDTSLRQIIRTFMDSGKIVAAICHAPWSLISSGCADGKQLTSYHSIQDDVRNAGGDWVNQEVVIDQNLITSRKPEDIPAFNTALIKLLATN